MRREPDADGDGHPSIPCGGDDCDDTDPDRFPGNSEICDEEAHDEDCNPATFGVQDIDEDGETAAVCCNVDSSGTRRCGLDCDDSDPTTHKNQAEICDQVDNDCDERTDEGFECALGMTRPCSTPVGEAGLQSCTAACIYEACTTDEVCNDADDDNDGRIDEDFPCRRGTARSCTRCGVESTQVCRANCSGYSACRATEVCNGCDDDRDGRIDERLHVYIRRVSGSALTHCGYHTNRLCATDIAGTCVTASPRGNHCQATGGFGQLEIGSTGPDVMCVRPVAPSRFYEEVSVSALTAEHDGCPNNWESCRAAVSRWCISRGFVSGYGWPRGGAAGAAWSVVCLASAHAVARTINWSALTAIFSQCTASHRDPYTCPVAVHRWCQARGYPAGYGPIEFTASQLTVFCIRDF